jgi:cytochrome c-type biogenesis protein CcmH/NrfG
VQQEADQRQAQALRLVSERLEKVAKREPLALHLLLFGVAPLLVAIIGVGVYFLLRSPDQPEPGPAPPPTRAARAAKMPASRAVAPTPRLPARPDAGAPAPEPDATASARPAPLPTHVVEPEPDPKWRGKLSRRQRRAKWALRRKLLRRAGRRLRGKRYTEAKELLTQALAMADGVRVRQLLATTHERTGQLDAAAYHMGKALERSPKRIKPYLHDRLGTIQIRLNQKEHACASFREALRLKPTLPRVKFHLKRHCR